MGSAEVTKTRPLSVSSNADHYVPQNFTPPPSPFPSSPSPQPPPTPSLPAHTPRLNHNSAMFRAFFFVFFSLLITNKQTCQYFSAKMNHYTLFPTTIQFSSLDPPLSQTEKKRKERKPAPASRDTISCHLPVCRLVRDRISL